MASKIKAIESKNENSESEAGKSCRVKDLPTFPGFEESIPRIHRQIDSHDRKRISLSEVITGKTIWGSNEKALRFDDDGLMAEDVADKHELNNLLESPHSDSKREKIIRKRMDDRAKVKAGIQAEIANELNARNLLSGWVVRAEKFLRVHRRTLAVEVKLPKGVGDLRVYNGFLEENAALTERQEKVTNAPVALDEKIATWTVDHAAQIRKGNNSFNLDGHEDPDGNHKVHWGGLIQKDSISGQLIEIPEVGPLLCAIFPKETLQFGIAKLRASAERSTGALTDDERKKKLSEIRAKREQLHLKIEAEYLACIAKGIPVYRPRDLSIWATLRARPVRERDTIERERSVHVRD